MTPRPHDALFKAAFEAPAHAAALLREVVPAALCDAIAWETLDHEPGSFVDPKLGDRHSDLLFSALLRTGERALVYLLLEHQSTEHPSMPLRMLAYQIRIWDRFRKEHPGAPLPPIIAVLVSHVPGGWTAARSFEDLFEPAVLAIPGLAALVPRCSMIIVDLAHLTDDDLKARSLAVFQKLALWLLRDARDPVRFLSSFGAWASALAEAERAGAGIDSFTIVVEYMFRVTNPVYHEEVRVKLRELGPRAEGVTMTIADYLHDQGLQKGLQQGQIAALRRLLLFKFQTLDPQYEARLEAATQEAIDRYFQRVLTADSAAAVFES
jgi:hypothetical protein